MRHSTNQLMENAAKTQGTGKVKTLWYSDRSVILVPGRGMARDLIDYRTVLMVCPGVRV